MTRFAFVVGLALAIPIAYLATYYDQTFLGVVLAAFWGLLCAIGLRRPRDPTWLTAVVIVGLLIRFPLVLAHLLIAVFVYGGQVDLYGFFGDAIEIPWKFLRGELELAAYYGSRNAGASIINTLSALIYLVVGPSLPGMFLGSGIVGFFGSCFFLRAFLTAFPTSAGLKGFALAIFFFPSVAFWTSVLGKDSWMFFFLGGASYCLAHLVQGVRPRYVVGLALCIGLVTLIRPPIGIALLAAASIPLLLIVRGHLGVGPVAILRPVAYVLAIVVLSAALFATSRGLYQYGVVSETDSAAEGLVTLALETRQGFSTDPGDAGERSLGASLRSLPFAMFTFLFRPFIFEAHNALALAAALDSTLLLALVLWRCRHLWAGLRSAFTRPFPAYCVTALVLFTAGLSFEANFGVIVRHRAMVVPFLFMLLFGPARRGEDEGPRRPAPAPVSAGHASGA